LEWEKLLFAVRAELAAFASWWPQQLRELTDAILARIVPRFAKPALVRFEGEQASILVDGAPQPLESNAAPSRPRAVVMLDDRRVLRHELTLPVPVERELERALELHLERELPLARSAVCVDWKVVHRDRLQQRIVVRLLAVRVEHVEQVRNHVSECGLRPVRVCVDDGAGGIVGNFLSSSAGRQRMRFTQLDRRLAALSAGLAVALGALIGGQWFYERLQVGREVQRVSAAARMSKTLTQQLVKNSASGLSLTHIMERPDAIDVLTRLTYQVPQDTWAYELEIAPGVAGSLQVKLTGFTPTATMLVDLLAKTPELENVRLVSATSAGLGSGRDRLQLTARWPNK